jgi:hypothetical protein
MPVEMRTGNKNLKTRRGRPGFGGGEFARFSWLFKAIVWQPAGGEFAQTPTGQAQVFLDG